ncbi:hypothetical protein F8M41_002691 [Gigaspora margarita]|uniref:Uncharacterized protein n=1 Tax=Gigaspora margarita TaxID=4874 RepID=A0A8H4AYM7_GIGMA|nr:hypothetical protein F8M41_002691 [Gigaspora margarita]
MNKNLPTDKIYDTIYYEYKHTKISYKQSKLAKEKYKAIQTKLFNITSAFSNHIVAFKLHFFFGVSCKQNIDNGYRKIIEASNHGLPDIQLWIKNLNDYVINSDEKAYFIFIREN